MGCEMRRTLLVGAILLGLAGCGREDTKATEEELTETPQIASLEDYGLPVDKSDQITSIDAATGDSSGMPRDGGGVVEVQKQEERPTVQAQEASNVNTTMTIPEVAAPPPPPTAPALTIPLGN